MKDFLSEMLYALTSAYTQKDYDNVKNGNPLETNIGKLFSILAWGLDTVQEQSDAMKRWDNIDNAHGTVLNRYGANLGVKRFGANDTFYRLAIKVKVLSQLSGGDIDTVLNTAVSLFGVPSECVSLTELFPAKVNIDVNEADLTPETLMSITDIATLLKRIAVAGVDLVTTLHSFRGFSGNALVKTSFYEKSSIVFDLPYVERMVRHGAIHRNALFLYSQIITTQIN